ncbi:MAG: tetratricopeptide repeat protein, partial [Planctomycetota bacterium]
SDRVTALNEEGVQLYQKGEYPQALQLFQEALKLEPEAKEIRTNIGKTFAALAAKVLEGNDPRSVERRSVRSALENLRLSLIYWQGDATTYHITGLCHFILGELPAAESALVRAVKLNAGSFPSWRLLGVVREQRQKLPEAIEAFQHARALVPGDPWLRQRLRRLRFDEQALHDFPVLESHRFRISYSPQLARGLVEAIQKTFEATAEALERRWGLSPTRGVVVICYPPGEFNTRTGLHEEVGGAFDGKIRIAFPQELEKGGLGLDQVVRHETVHLLLHRLGNDPPRWVDEGLAQLLDGDPREGWRETFLRGVQAAPHLGLLDRNRRFREDQPKSWAPLYQHSFWFFRHLAETHRNFRIDMMVRKAAGGMSWSRAFKAVYGASAEALDRGWRRTLLSEVTPGG